MTREEMQIAAKKELQRLTDQINAFIKQRKEFITENGHLFAPFIIGQKVINRNNLEFGVVIDYYQLDYRSNYHDFFNTHCQIMRCDHDWNPKRLIDNTSAYYLKSEMPWMDFEEYKKEFYTIVEEKY